MLHKIAISQTPAFSVIQGACESFITAPQGEEQSGANRVYFSTEVTEIIHAPFQLVLPTEPPIEDWLKFQGLASAWQDERRGMSSITEIALCPSYQSIIGMGEIAIRFIMGQLESEGDDPDQWFWALRAITNADPVREQDRGDYSKMAQSWLQWAKVAGYAD